MKSSAHSINVCLIRKRVNYIFISKTSKVILLLRFIINAWNNDNFKELQFRVRVSLIILFTFPILHK